MTAVFHMVTDAVSKRVLPSGYYAQFYVTSCVIRSTEIYYIETNGLLVTEDTEYW